MKKIIGMLLILPIILAGISFAVLNADTVSLNYYIGAMELPLAVVILIALMVGVLLGISVSLGFLIGKRSENTRLKHKLVMMEKEIKNLREIPLKI